MQLIGMLDSPYVRRVAVSLRLLAIPFDHRPVSVFSTFAEFQRINPVVKAPSLICDDGQVLMDSTLILDYAQRLAAPRTLMPKDLRGFQQATRILGLALAGCEKAVQIVYEHNLRPPEKHHRPWLDRVTGQLLAAFEALEAEVSQRPLATTPDTLSQAGVTTAIVWRFAQMMVPEIVLAHRYPLLAAHSNAAEALPAFHAFPPDGPGVPSA